MKRMENKNNMRPGSRDGGRDSVRLPAVDTPKAGHQPSASSTGSRPGSRRDKRDSGRDSGRDSRQSGSSYSYERDERPISRGSGSGRDLPTPSARPARTTEYVASYLYVLSSLFLSCPCLFMSPVITLLAPPPPPNNVYTSLYVSSGLLRYDSRPITARSSNNYTPEQEREIREWQQQMATDKPSGGGVRQRGSSGGASKSTGDRRRSHARQEKEDDYEVSSKGV
jgi:hypothetical protein